MESDDVLEVVLEELVDGSRRRFFAWCERDTFVRVFGTGLMWLTGTGFSATVVATTK
jgi:hypothetical protein